MQASHRCGEPGAGEMRNRRSAAILPRPAGKHNPGGSLPRHPFLRRE
ncbi:hypothetical protein HMPREF1546_01069 [Oscillibacter sp. KLE 1745]|nr:hypothetical protein HMPREF1546_01069 [Oscillibacter sp. KLE 1745]